MELAFSVLLFHCIKVETDKHIPFCLDNRLFVKKELLATAFKRTYVVSSIFLIRASAHIPVCADVCVICLSLEKSSFQTIQFTSWKKRIKSVQIMWIKHLNHGYRCAERLCPCVLEIKLRALRSKELGSGRRPVITVLPLNKYCQSCLPSV